MSIGGFLIHVGTDVATCIFHDLSVKEINRVMGDFMCEFNGTTPLRYSSHVTGQFNLGGGCYYLGL